MGVTQGAGLSLQWFRNNLCRDYMERAEKEGRDAYDYINEDVESVPLGSNRLIYLPYLMGERTPSSGSRLPRRVLRPFGHPYQKGYAEGPSWRAFPIP